MQPLPFSIRQLALATLATLLVIWSAAGLLAVIAFAAMAELCLQALVAHRQRIDAETDPDR